MLFREAIAAGVVSASDYQWKIINDILYCRTEFLGGHLYRCGACGADQPQYNSCRNRHCPKCQGGESAKWLKARAKELLNVPYFHLVLYHPHLHVVIPGVIIKEDGSIKRSRDNYFLSRKKLAIVFRAIFLRMIRAAYRAKMLLFLDPNSEENFLTVLPLTAKVEWHCYAKKPFATPECVLKYLSLYTHKIAISNSRLRAYKDGNVLFAYRDRESGYKEKMCTIALPEFICRFLLHTLSHQFVRIRHYGFLANGVRTKQPLFLRARIDSRPLSIREPSQPLCSCCGKPALNYVNLRLGHV